MRSFADDIVVTYDEIVDTLEGAVINLVMEQFLAYCSPISNRVFTTAGDDCR